MRAVTAAGQLEAARVSVLLPRGAHSAGVGDASTGRVLLTGLRRARVNAFRGPNCAQCATHSKPKLELDLRLTWMSDAIPLLTGGLTPLRVCYPIG